MNHPKKLALLATLLLVVPWMAVPADADRGSSSARVKERARSERSGSPSRRPRLFVPRTGPGPPQPRAFAGESSRPSARPSPPRSSDERSRREKAERYRSDRHSGSRYDHDGSRYERHDRDRYERHRAERPRSQYPRHSGSRHHRDYGDHHRSRSWRPDRGHLGSWHHDHWSLYCSHYHDRRGAFYYRPRFEIPRSIVFESRSHWDPYHYGEVWFADHGHYHVVYVFPDYGWSGVDWVPYSYCDSGLFARGSFRAGGLHFDIRLGF